MKTLEKLFYEFIAGSLFVCGFVSLLLFFGELFGREKMSNEGQELCRRHHYNGRASFVSCGECYAEAKEEFENDNREDPEE